ncbi:hypothetical protein B0H14DRAFT_3874560 [Mycena olivaceomarginata]|nr:hypothetical protein B0H14DRAFT_3874560 [Mycena olivaceomarginata]
MLAPCLGGLSFQPTKSDAVECDHLCNRLTTISFKKRSCEPLRDLPSSFYSGGRPVSPGSLSVMPRVCIVSSPLVPLFSWDAPPRTEAHASIRCLVYPTLHRGRPVLPQPSYAPFFAQFPKLIDPRSAIPCFLYVSSLPTQTTRRLPSPSCLHSIYLLYAHAASPCALTDLDARSALPPQGTYSALNSQCSLNPRRDPHPRLLMPIPSVFLQGRLVSSFIIPHLHLQVRTPTCSPPSVHIHHHGNAVCIKAPSYPPFFRV